MRNQKSARRERAVYRKEQRIFAVDQTFPVKLGRATLSAAEAGCQAEIGVASSMAAALIATANDATPRVVENAAESALEHHLGMTCDPVAGYVQVPCIERCAFGAVKAWTAYMIASNEIASRHRVDLDATITAMAQTAKEMNSKYKETSEAGLALSVTLC